MKYCESCGRLLDEGNEFCPVCSGKVKNAEAYFHSHILFRFFFCILIPLLGIFLFIKTRRQRDISASIYGYACLFGCLIYLLFAVFLAVI